MDKQPPKLSEQWKIALSIIFSPIVLIVLLFTIVAFIFAIIFSDKPVLALTLAAISSISSGVLGGIAWEKYREKNGDVQFLKKGKSAVRNLVLIADQLNRLRNRLIERDHKKAPLTVDDVDHDLITTEKQVIAAIDDWVDMVPELKAEAEVARSLSQESDKYKELLNEKTELEKSLDQQGADKKMLEAEIKNKNIELGRVRAEISQLKGQQQLTFTGSNRINRPLSASTLLSGFNNVNRVCSQCGKLYQANGLSTITTNKCTDCANTVTL